MQIWTHTQLPVAFYKQHSGIQWRPLAFLHLCNPFANTNLRYTKAFTSVLPYSHVRSSYFISENIIVFDECVAIDIIRVTKESLIIGHDHTLDTKVSQCRYFRNPDTFHNSPSNHHLGCCGSRSQPYRVSTSQSNRVSDFFFGFVCEACTCVSPGEYA